MTRTKKFFSNAVGFSIFNGLNKFIGFLLIPIYTNYFSVTVIGLYDLYLVYSLFFFPIFSLQVFEAIFFYSYENKNKSNQLNMGKSSKRR